jgi:hypothetical protein
MDELENLKTNLARAGIPARVSNRSFLGNVTGRIVQMDIRKERGVEELRITVPEGEAAVQVLGVDREINQAVLLVREGEREFQERVWNAQKKDWETVTRKTSGEKRRFLVGMDEAHLFIAQLSTPATTVKQAHEGLWPKALPRGRTAKKLGVRRQGEWFFTPVSAEERVLVEKHAKKSVAKNVGIGRLRPGLRGRPHVVSESVLVPFGESRTEFVRGRVAHPDHHAIQLHDWHSVAMNTENRETLARFSNWVD